MSLRGFTVHYFMDGQEVDYSEARVKQYSASDMYTLYVRDEAEPESFSEMTLARWGRDPDILVSPDGRSAIATRKQGDF